MQSLNEKIERSLFKIFLSIGGVLLLFVAGGYFSVRAFHAWQLRRLLAEAYALVDRDDYKSASAAAQRMLQINPESADANRVLARSAEGSGARAAVEFRRRVADLTHNNNASDLLAWAKSALRFNDAASAERALDLVPEKMRETADYHALRGDVALLRRDLTTYEQELTQALKIDPGHKALRLSLATYHAASSVPATHERGVRDLQALAQDDATRRDALRRLIDDALRRREWGIALENARQLEAMVDRTFSDRLLFLTTLKATNDAAFSAVFAEMQKEASDDAAKIAALVSWMNREGMNAQAVAWIKALPPTLLTQKTLPLAVADAFVAAREWEPLRKFLIGANWGPVDYMRSALLARALRELNQPESSAQQWAEAVQKVSARADRSLLLAESAQKWGWEKEWLDLLWLAAKDPNKADRTLGTLYRFFAAKNDTQELYRVLLHLSELHPNDRPTLNNLAQISLLLNLNAERGHQLAREVHEQDPFNIHYASTYAFSLYLRDEPKKAVQLLASFPETKLRQPSIAAYFGIALAANGENGRAAEFLELGAKANLLPEERALLEKARNAVARR